jgi:CBS domain-containing membrane protein
MNLRPPPLGRAARDWLHAGRAGLGAAVALACVGLGAQWAATGRLSAEPLLIAPIGASAVLVFAVPASPLAQPRALIGGNLFSCLVGVTAGLLIPDALTAAVVAVGAAVAGMMVLRCLHPPGGAIALTAAFAGGAPSLAAYLEALSPVVGSSLLLAAAAALYINLTGRTYPHRVAPQANPHATADPPPQRHLGYTQADLDAALAQYGELLDVSRDDLDALFQRVELQAQRRIHSAIRCADVMSHDVVAVHDDQSCESALAFLQKHDLRTAPVIDRRGRVVGLVRRAELVTGRGRLVADVVDPFVHKVRPGSAIETLLPLLSSGATHEAMVVDEDRRLVGVITQTDLLAVLYRAHIIEAVVSQRAA